MVKNNKIKIGIVGAGFISQICHISNFAKNKNCEIIALADLRKKLRNKVAKKFKIKNTYSSHKDLLENKQIEAVIVITGRENIGPIAYDCLNKKKHVFTEKPSAHTFAQAKKLVDLAKRKKVKYVVGYMKKYDEGVKKAKKILQNLIYSKKFGNLNFIRVHNFMGDSYCNPVNYIKSKEKIPKNIPSWPKSPGWIKKKNVKHYASYLNTYCHDLNLIRHFFNSEIKIEYTNLSKMDGRLTVFKINDFLCSFETGRSEYSIWDETIEMYFTKGILKLKFPAPLLKKNCEIYIYNSHEKNEKKLNIKNSWAFENQAKEFINTIRSNKNSLNPGEDALKDLEVFEKIWKF
jgi:predicted dehydrogenase